MSNSDESDGTDDTVDEHGESVLTLEDPAEGTADDADDADAAEPDETVTSSGLKRRLVAGLLALVAVAAMAALVVLSIGEYQHRQDESLRTEAVQMSRDYLVAMAAFDYQKMDANREHIVANSTPGFAAKYDEMVKALRDNRGDQQGCRDRHGRSRRRRLARRRYRDGRRVRRPTRHQCDRATRQ
ncbi:hypothetical protein [Mycolicibacterium septicum]|uniref:hypothetical protein n=1 Tax=Mycolicibacterium septicum TaxID=98668 RepID=UPI000424AAEC|nr:hypothetical protein [Mycolicibacterium septicum]